MTVKDDEENKIKAGDTKNQTGQKKKGNKIAVNDKDN
jgi:hypothetical protein